MRLYLIRHARRSYPHDGLTDRGHREARALARRLRSHRVDHLFSSPLRRARQTAGHLAEHLDLPVWIEPWLAEREEWRLSADAGDRPVWEVDPAAARRALVGGDPGAAPALGGPELASGFGELAAASDRFLRHFGYLRDGVAYRVRGAAAVRVAVVGHAGVGRAWLAHLLALPAPLVWAGFRLPEASITEIGMEAHDGVAVPRCHRLGDVAHLENGLPQE